jgi:hypothetical protein
LNWAAVSGIIGGSGAVAGFFLWVLRLQFRAELAEFRADLLRELNGKYMNAETAEARLEALQEGQRGLAREFQDARGEMQRAWRAR